MTKSNRSTNRGNAAARTNANSNAVPTPTGQRPAGSRPKSSTRSASSGKTSSVKPPILLWVALAGAIILIGIMVIAGLPRDNGADAAGPADGTNSAAPTLSDLARRVPTDVAAQGSVDAPVVILEYADYRCPYCAHFDRDTLPQIITDYIDAGKVRFEWRDFPIFGDESTAAAVAARAAGEQGLFWEYHTAVFAAAPDRGHPDLPTERLIDFARQVGVPDLDRFAADLNSPELAAQVRADQTEGSAIGVSSAPTFIVNDTPVVGAQPYEAFRQAIDAELAKAEKKNAAR